MARPLDGINQTWFNAFHGIVSTLQTTYDNMPEAKVVSKTATETRYKCDMRGIPIIHLLQDTAWKLLYNDPLSKYYSPEMAGKEYSYDEELKVLKNTLKDCHPPRLRAEVDKLFTIYCIMY